MIDDKDLIEDDNGFYVLNTWPKKDFGSLAGFTMSSNEEEFIDAAKKLLKTLKVKGREMEVRRVPFKIKNVGARAQYLVIYLNDDIYGEGHVHLKWTFEGKKKGTTLHFSKVKGCDPSHVQKVLYVMKYLIDGTIDNVFSPEMIESFIVGNEEVKDACANCGQIFKTATGLSHHQCARVNDKVESMEVAKDISNEDAQGFVEALVSHVVESGVLNRQETLPTPRPDLTCNQYIDQKLPGGQIKHVVGDGACLPRAISLVCFGSEEYWKIVAMAINKMAVKKIKEDQVFDFPLKRVISGKGEHIFNDKDAFINFLKSESSLFMWREEPDIVMASELLECRIDVLISRNGKLEGGCPIVYGEEFEDGGKIVLLLSTEEEHYRAVVDPSNSRKHRNLLDKLKNYLERNEADNMKEEIISVNKSLETLNEKVESMQKIITNLKAECDGKFAKLEFENKVLKDILCKRNPQRPERDVPASSCATGVGPSKVSKVSKVSNADLADQVIDLCPGPMDCDQELVQLQRLQSLKQQGFSRQDPSAPPVRKKSIVSCMLCKVDFDNEENLKKHNEKNHGIIKKNESNKNEDCVSKSRIPHVDNKNSNEALKARIPVINGQAREYNCLDCDFQASGNGSSKSLLKHSRQTKHKTSSLEEKCFSCHEIFNNFEEMMSHRRNKHGDKINLCRYLSEGSCKFGERCWYSHDETKSNDSSKRNVDFRKAKESLPPDLMHGVTVLLSDLIKKHLEEKRSPGA